MQWLKPLALVCDTSGAVTRETRLHAPPGMANFGVGSEGVRGKARMGMGMVVIGDGTRMGCEIPVR